MDTTTQPKPRAIVTAPGRADAVAVVVVILLVAIAGYVGLQPPDRVARLSVTNPTPYDLHIDARSPDEVAVVRLGTVQAGHTHDLREMPDQGETWVLRFSGQGRSGGEVTVTRADLSQADWTITVPDEVGAALERAGAPPNPGDR